MTASSVTGTGKGDSNKLTVNGLSALENGPVIYIVGTDESESGFLPLSPPSPGNIVTFPEALPGSSDNYCVFLTSQNGGYTYTVELLETNGNFSGFSYVSESICTVMYMVARKGVRPKV